MTTFTTARTTAPAITGGVFSRMMTTIATWNDARITRKALVSLSARELDDIGLSPADIDTIVAQGARR